MQAVRKHFTPAYLRQLGRSQANDEIPPARQLSAAIDKSDRKSSSTAAASLGAEASTATQPSRKRPRDESTADAVVTPPSKTGTAKSSPATPNSPLGGSATHKASDADADETVSRKKARTASNVVPGALQQAKFTQRRFDEQQVALTLTQFAAENTDLDLGKNQVENLIGTLIVSCSSA